jgi:hypothetical protein
MRRFFSMVLGASIVFIVLGFLGSASAASEQAIKLRAQNGLSEYAPPEGFLAGNFVADEVDPGCIFGAVKDFVKTRSCPATWLIEDGERNRITADGHQSGPIEYTLYLEEDCPGKVVYFVFVDRSRADTAQWIAWRKQFHKSKTDPQYSAARACLDQAARNGFPVAGELRFVEVDGNLVVEKPEDLLIGELKFQPIFDLKSGKAVNR